MHRTLLSLLAAACAAIAASDSCPGHVLDGSCFHCRGSEAHCKSDGSNAQADTPAKCCQACTEVEACNAWSVTRVRNAKEYTTAAKSSLHSVCLRRTPPTPPEITPTVCAARTLLKERIV